MRGQVREAMRGIIDPGLEKGEVNKSTDSRATESRYLLVPSDQMDLAGRECSMMFNVKLHQTQRKVYFQVLQ